jgi:hypothetical protein
MKYAIVKINEYKTVVEVSKSLPLAKGRAYELALDNLGVTYRIYKITHDLKLEPTNSEYKSYKIINPAVGQIVNINDDCLRG